MREIFGQVVLWLCCAFLAAGGVTLLARGLARIPAFARAFVRKCGLPTALLLLALAVYAMIDGTPTHGNKGDGDGGQTSGETGGDTNAPPLVGAVAPSGWTGAAGSLSNESDPSEEGDSDGSPRYATDDGDSSDGSGIFNSEPIPSIRPVIPADYASGVALAQIGTNEVWDFSAPAGAEICTDWLEFGAERDWFKIGNSEEGIVNSYGRFSFLFGINVVDALTVFSYGTARPVMTNTATFFSPFQAGLGIVPFSNWHLLPFNLQPSTSNLQPSQFWQYLTPSNTFVMTWQNVLLDRASDRPVSFQAEFEENGNVTFRYDLSRLAEDVVTNLVVGISNDGVGRVFNALPRDTTSLKWVHLDPTRPLDNDPDNDGATTEDEVFIHGTDPYRADTDMDGLSDGQEVNETSTDPLDPHSVDPRYPDGVAVVLGDVDPFSYPEGSTNTVLEHVFYTGTTNAPFAYPQSTDGTAVLRVSVSGTGSGELIVGNQVVPLLGASVTGVAARDLLLTVGRGAVNRIVRRGGVGLAVGLDSDDFCVGVLPSGAGTSGWCVFPNTRASVPCIHDLNAKRVEVSLDPGLALDGLTCTWNPGPDIQVENHPPLSATLTGAFPRNRTTPVSYTLSHPLHLFGRAVHSQTARFCPRLADDEDDDGIPEGDGGSSFVDPPYGDGHPPWCWCWTGCTGCDCPCHYREETVPAASDPETCPIHDCSYSVCEPYHRMDFDAATNSPSQLADVLLLHDPAREGDVCHVGVTVPRGWVRCCECPGHWTNYVSLAYRNSRVSVHLDGEPFERTVDDCTLDVVGVSPSAAVGDAVVALCRTGEVYEVRRYTVFGVGIGHDTLDLDLLNGLNASFGLPTTAHTNLDAALTLRLRTDVDLPDGNVRLALENATARMQLWMQGADGHDRLVLDTSVKSSLDLPVARWRQLAAPATFGHETTVRILTFGEGRARLYFGYAGHEGGACFHDGASQVITVVPPPLLPDYNRDGAIDAADAAWAISGRPYRFWTNEDCDKGDYVGQYSDTRPNVESDPGLANVKGRLDLVNLFPIALNLGPLTEAWGTAVTCSLRMDAVGAGPLRFCFADVPWNASFSIQTGNVQTVSGEPLHSASLLHLDHGTYTMPHAAIGGFAPHAGLLVAEAAERVDWRPLTLEVRLGEVTLFEHELPLQIVPVKEMYSWINGRHLSGGEEFRPTTYRVRGFDRALVFLHGANVSEADAERWGDSVFKRMWLSGMKADFYNVDWRSDMGLTGANYQQNASNAFEVASQLAPVIASIPGEKVVMAHSLGNMVVSSMIQDHGLSVARYLMCNSAVPAEAYDSSSSLRVPQLVHPDWEDYPTNTWTACWHSLFNGFQNDDRRLLGWPGRFASVAQYAVNFYSTGDEVLELSQENDLNVFTGVTGGFGHLSWHKQELFKGRASLTSGLGRDGRVRVETEGSELIDVVALT